MTTVQPTEEEKKANLAKQIEEDSLRIRSISPDIERMGLRGDLMSFLDKPDISHVVGDQRWQIGLAEVVSMIERIMERVRKARFTVKKTAVTKNNMRNCVSFYFNKNGEEVPKKGGYINKDEYENAVHLHVVSEASDGEFSVYDFAGRFDYWFLTAQDKDSSETKCDRLVKATLEYIQKEYPEDFNAFQARVDECVSSLPALAKKTLIQCLEKKSKIPAGKLEAKALEKVKGNLPKYLVGGLENVSPKTILEILKCDPREMSRLINYSKANPTGFACLREEDVVEAQEVVRVGKVLAS